MTPEQEAEIRKVAAWCRMGEGDLYGPTLGEAAARALISVWEAA